MSKIIFAISTMWLCTACNTQATKQQPIRLQMKISCTGLAKFESQIFSKGKQEFLMFGDPAQEMWFRNQDTINYVFPLGKENASEHLDTMAIGRGETLSFLFVIKENKQNKAAASNTKPVFRANILANGRIINSIELPTTGTFSGSQEAHDSTASLVINTDSL